MRDEYNDEIENDYIMRANERRRIREEKRQAELIKKETTRKKVKIAVIAAIASASLIYASGLPNYIDGHNKIVQEFESANDGYYVQDSSRGFVIWHGSDYTSNDEEFYQEIDKMIENGKEAGMPDNEIYIGLEEMISNGAAKDAYDGQDLSIVDKWNTCVNKSDAKVK